MAQKQQINRKMSAFPQAYSYVDVPVKTVKKRKTVQNALHRKPKKKSQLH